DILGDFTSTTLFHFTDASNLHDLLSQTHASLWNDISHSLYSGLEVQRDLSKLYQLDATKAVSPIIFTSVMNQQNHQLNRSP
ncbi:hypothetical protein ABTJ67_20885, partial [Acinetobacter baumannii]